MQLRIEVVGRKRLQLAQEPRVCETGGERVALQPVAGGEEAWRLLGRARQAAPRRRQPGQGLARQVEPVGEEAESLLALG